MPRITINHKEIDADSGSTVLDTARAAGFNIPTLCHVPGLPASGSCMVCAVRVNESPWLVPACATSVRDGMRVETDSESIRIARKRALELLLSEHLGDCVGPCETVCAGNMNIPLMIRQLRAGDLRGAIATVKERIPMPAITGRICPAPCEKVCRRGFLQFPGKEETDGTFTDQPVSIAGLERYIADCDLFSDNPYIPPCRSLNGRRIAIVGAGPAGLSAAYYLRQMGYACTIFDDNEAAGGALRICVDRDTLPAAVLDAEIALIAAMGVDFRMNYRVGRDTTMAELRKSHDAIVLAVGKIDPEKPQKLDVPLTRYGFEVDRHTMMTPVQHVLACGDAIRPHHMAIRAMSEGRTAAISLEQLFNGKTVTGPPHLFNVHIGKPLPEETPLMIAQAQADSALRTAPPDISAGLTAKTAREEAARCLRCDCRKRDACRLRDVADRLDAHPRAFKEARKTYTVEYSHPEIIFEAGKCIACGNCVNITARAGEDLGLSFRGRGFSVIITVPFDEDLAKGLQKTARECVTACPTAALSFRQDIATPEQGDDGDE